MSVTGSPITRRRDGVQVSDSETLTQGLVGLIREKQVGLDDLEMPSPGATADPADDFWNGQRGGVAMRAVGPF
jgi:hypothetical protein